MDPSNDNFMFISADDPRFTATTLNGN